MLILLMINVSPKSFRFNFLGEMCRIEVKNAHIYIYKFVCVVYETTVLKYVTIEGLH